MSAWRAAGISYVRFSFVAANAMKKALKPEAAVLRGAASGQNVISRKWVDGQPTGEFNYGAKEMDA